MADVVLRSTQPALGAIKLAWWRERLEELDHGAVPAEPRLRAAADELLARGIGGHQLASLEEGWAAFLDPSPDLALVAEHGARLFSLAARLLGVPFGEPTVLAAGRMFAGVDAARRGLVAAPPSSPGAGPAAVSRRARPLTALAALANRDLRRGGPPFEPEATPGRALALLRHRITGRI